MESPWPTVWTVGHSTRVAADFIQILKIHQINKLVDVRSFLDRGDTPSSTAQSCLNLLLVAEFAITTCQLLGADAGRRPIRRILRGGIRHFVRMPITWKQWSSNWDLNNWLNSRARTGLRLCVLRRYGGAVIAA